MARVHLAAALCLAALCCCASATRYSQWDKVENALHGGNSVKAMKWIQEGLDKRGDDKHAHGAFVAIKYQVPPSTRDDFIKEWRKVEDATKDEKGVRIYDLKKTIGDNIFYWTYGEWKSMEDYVDHFRADYTEKFLDFIDQRDITWELFPLKNVTDNSQEGRHHNSFQRKKGGDDPRDMDAHVVIQYHVPPSLVDKFVPIWTETAQKTWDEEENSIYALRKFATMNHHFIAYGTWDSYDAYMDHFQSDHVRKLREFAAKNDIQWFAEPLIKLGDQPERS